MYAAADVAKKHGVSAHTIYSWRKHFGSLELSDVKHLRQLEQENGRLKRMVADLTDSGLKDAAERIRNKCSINPGAGLSEHWKNWPRLPETLSHLKVGCAA